MAPKQATLGYVKPAQQTLGCAYSEYLVLYLFGAPINLTSCIDARKFFGNGSAMKPKPQQSTLAFDRGRAKPKAAKHDIARKDDGHQGPAAANGMDEDVKSENDEVVEYNVNTKDAVDDEAMADAEVLPNITGTAH